MTTPNLREQILLHTESSLGLTDCWATDLLHIMSSYEPPAQMFIYVKERPDFFSYWFFWSIFKKKKGNMSYVVLLAVSCICLKILFWGLIERILVLVISFSFVSGGCYVVVGQNGQWKKTGEPGGNQTQILVEPLNHLAVSSGLFLLKSLT